MFLIIFILVNIISIHGQVKILDAKCVNDNFPSFLCNSTFSDPRYLKTTSESVLHIGVSLKIINKNNNNANNTGFDEGFKGHVQTFFSHLLQLSTGTTQHWIILTDNNSINVVNSILRNIIMKHVTSNIISTYQGRKTIRRVPKIIIDYIDLDGIANDARADNIIKSMHSFQLFNVGKYLDKLFYVGPMYHWIFPNLNKLIFMDVDLDIHTDIKVLFQQFSEFNSSNIIGVGYDLSPHYRLNLEQYRKWHPGSTLGDPGPTQGFNTGVVLFDLDRMRGSDKYNSFLDPDEVKRVISKYGYHISLGDQDWFTNIGFESPDLFYRLPCQFNAQISVQYWRPPWEEVFEEYHHCEKPFHIIHKNGCGPTREICDETLKRHGMI